MSFSHIREPFFSVERKPISVTVGPVEGEFVGSNHRAIQAAIEYVASCGGGAVYLLPGVYDIGNALHLKTGISLVGSGEDTVLKRIPSVTMSLIANIDWYEWKAQVQDVSGFTVGGALYLTSIGELTNTEQGSVHTIAAIEGNTLYLDSQPRMNHWVDLDAKASSVSSIIKAEYAEHILVENLTIDGNRENNDLLSGNYGGAVFMQDCQHAQFKNVHIRDFNGDGMSWQICDDVLVEDCSIRNCPTSALHPGSGSQRPVIRRTIMDSCDIGVGWCWGVTHGVMEENTITGCRIGTSVGHRDTDNVIRRNKILDTLETAIDLVPTRSPDRTAHRTVIEENMIRNARIGIRLARGLQDVVIRRNTFSDSQGWMSPGILIEPGVTRLVLDENTFDNIREQTRELTTLPPE